MLKPAPKGVLARKLADRTMSGRARLYHWLKLNYAELAEAKEDLNYTWRDMAATIAEAGAVNAFGKPPAPEAVRKAWLKLVADMSAKAHPVVRSPVKQPVQPVQSVAQAAAPTEPPDTPPPRKPRLPNWKPIS